MLKLVIPCVNWKVLFEGHFNIVGLCLYFSRKSVSLIWRIYSDFIVKTTHSVKEGSFSEFLYHQAMLLSVSLYSPCPCVAYTPQCVPYEIL